jgi:hypothetical protein
MTMIKRLVTAVLGVLVCAAAAYAHHPFSAEYDWKKPVILNGILTEVNWANPHVHLTVDAKDGRGMTGVWTVELGSPAALQKYGLTKASFKSGEKIAIEGWAAIDGTLKANAKSVTLGNGQPRFAASSFFDPHTMGAIATSGSQSTPRK